LSLFTLWPAGAPLSVPPSGQRLIFYLKKRTLFFQSAANLTKIFSVKNILATKGGKKTKIFYFTQSPLRVDSTSPGVLIIFVKVPIVSSGQ